MAETDACARSSNAPKGHLTHQKVDMTEWLTDAFSRTIAVDTDHLLSMLVENKKIYALEAEEELNFSLLQIR